VERSALETIARILRGLGIRFVLIGALAANRYRVTTRLTQDVDLLLADLGAGLDALTRALAGEGFEVRRVDPGAAILRLRHPELGAADLIVAATDFEREAIARARPEPLGPAGPIHVVTPEDVIVLKLIAGRAQDLADVEAILAAGIALDEAYLERWAEYWEVEELWRRLRSA
jgi:predicted nucleotidyltransferase